MRGEADSHLSGFGQQQQIFGSEVCPIFPFNGVVLNGESPEEVLIFQRLKHFAFQRVVQVHLFCYLVAEPQPDAVSVHIFGFHYFCNLQIYKSSVLNENKN